MKKIRRMCITVTEELDRRLIELRKKPEYERMSLSQIARIMMERGMEQEEGA